eukprot:gene6128-7634_t
MEKTNKRKKKTLQYLLSDDEEEENLEEKEEEDDDYNGIVDDNGDQVYEEDDEKQYKKKPKKIARTKSKTTVVSSPKKAKKKQSTATTPIKTRRSAAAANNTANSEILLSFITTANSSSTTVVDEKDSKKILPTPTSNPSNEHPFFKKEEERIKKIKNKTVNQQAFEEKLKNGHVPEMFMSKEERDQLATEKRQEDFRLNIMKSNEDHAKILSGKTVHPFFSLQPSSSSTSKNSTDITTTNRDTIVISSSIYCNINFKLLEFPIDPEVVHVGWDYLESSKPVHPMIQNDSLVEKSLRISESDNKFNENLIIELGTLIPNFEVEKQKYHQQEQKQKENQSPPIIIVKDEIEIEQEREKKIKESMKKLFLIYSNHSQLLTFDMLNEQYQEFLSNLPTTLCNNMVEKYFQSRPSKIIGNNNEIVSFVENWIQHWRSKIDSRELKQTITRSKKSKQPQQQLCPILIVGPNGSGKTSLVYSKSELFNFRVLESNPSSRRSGKLLNDMFGEATQSKSLSSTKSTTLEVKNSNLILLEEIDITFEEDKGFLNSVSTFLETSKVPIILTCNGIVDEN